MPARTVSGQYCTKGNCDDVTASADKDRPYLRKGHLELAQLCDGGTDMAALVSLQLSLPLLAQDNDRALSALCRGYAGSVSRTANKSKQPAPFCALIGRREPPCAPS